MYANVILARFRVLVHSVFAKFGRNSRRDTTSSTACFRAFHANPLTYIGHDESATQQYDREASLTSGIGNMISSHPSRPAFQKSSLCVIKKGVAGVPIIERLGYSRQLCS